MQENQLGSALASSTRRTGEHCFHCHLPPGIQQGKKGKKILSLFFTDSDILISLTIVIKLSKTSHQNQQLLLTGRSGSISESGDYKKKIFKRRQCCACKYNSLCLDMKHILPSKIYFDCQFNIFCLQVKHILPASKIYFD